MTFKVRNLYRSIAYLQPTDLSLRFSKAHMVNNVIHSRDGHAVGVTVTQLIIAPEPESDAKTESMVRVDLQNTLPMLEFQAFEGCFSTLIQSPAIAVDSIRAVMASKSSLTS